MSNDGNKRQLKASVEFTGQAKDLESAEKQVRWKRFLSWFSPALGEGRQLAKSAKEITKERFESENDRTRAEAERTRAEAEKFQAEALGAVAVAELEKANTIKVVNDEIIRIFTAPDLPDSARALMLANLTAQHPEIEAQLEKIIAIMTKLRVVNFTQISISVEEGAGVPSKK